MNFFSVFFSFELIDMKPFQQEAGWGGGGGGGGGAEAGEGGEGGGGEATLAAVD